VITGVTEIAHITTKQDMSRWTRAHADAPGINWSVVPGPGGTMIIVEYAEDRRSLDGTNVTPEVDGTNVTPEVDGTNVTPEVAAPVANPVESAGAVRASA
jgi:hypothetical protein